MKTSATTCSPYSYERYLNVKIRDYTNQFEYVMETLKPHRSQEVANLMRPYLNAARELDMQIHRFDPDWPLLE